LPKAFAGIEPHGDWPEFVPNWTAELHSDTLETRQARNLLRSNDMPQKSTSQALTAVDFFEDLPHRAT